MNFTCTTVYDYPAIKTLQYAILYKKRNPTLCVVLRAVMRGVPAVLIDGAVIYLLFTGGADEMLPMWMMFGVLFSTLLFITLYLHIGAPKAAYRANSRNGEAKVVYTFRDSSFTADAVANGVSSSTNTAYTSLFAAYRTKSYYLLFMTKNSANLVSRANLTQEQDAWLENTLKNTLGKAYYTCKF